MLITSEQAIIQAIANIKLESLTLSHEIIKLLKSASHEKPIDTSYILKLLHEQ